MKNRKISLILLVLLPAIAGCGRNIESELEDHIAAHANYDVNGFVLEKLEQNRVVMVADAGHGVRLYLQSVLGILNHWLDTNIISASSESPICPELILVLEADSLQVKGIVEYGYSNDPYDVLDIGLLGAPQFTTAKLEYYHDLAELRKRIDQYNQTCRDDRQLSLSLFGPERPIEMDNWSVEKREQFFVYERDEFSSQRLAEHLKRHPESKTLVFYGESHLERARIAKGIESEPVEGYYLAHYLTETFGDNGGVYVLGQIQAGVGGGSYCRLFAAPRRSYGLDNTVFPYEYHANDSGITAKDGWLVLFGQYAPSMPLYQIYSEALLEFIVHNLPDLADTTNEFDRCYLSAAAAYLEMVPDTSSQKPYRLNSPNVIETIRAWQQWADTARVRYVASIESLDLWDRMVDRLAEADPSEVRPYIHRLNYSLGPRYALDWGEDMPPPREVAQHYREHLRIWRKEIVVERLVHMLWVCTDEECKAAVAVLKKETGREFTTAKEWMVWWSEDGYRSL